MVYLKWGLKFILHVLLYNTEPLKRQSMNRLLFSSSQKAKTEPDLPGCETFNT